MTTSLWQSIVDHACEVAEQASYFHSETASMLRASYRDCVQWVDQFIESHADATVLNILLLAKDLHAGRILFKSSDTCEKIRLEGNALFQERQLTQALDKYFTALMKAATGKEMSLLYGNISAVHFQVRQFGQSRRCIECALSLDCPTETRVRLQQRLEKCAQQVSDRKDDTPDSLSRWCTIHSSLQVHQHPQRGRYVITREALSPSEVILIERASVFSLNPEFSAHKCAACLGPVDVPEVCSRCAHVLYCSPSCRQSQEATHALECPFMFLLHGVGAGHLAWRAALNMWKSSTPDTEEEPFPHPLTVHSNSLAHLCTHFQETTTKSLFQYGLTAWLLSHLAQLAGVLQCEEERVDLAALLLRNLLQVQCNGHAIVALQETEMGASAVQVDQQRLAVGFFPLVSLLNHACEPNVYTSFVGDHLCVKVVKAIGAGEEICTSYGPHFLRQSVHERQQALQEQYHFQCRCTHCAEQCDYAFRRTDALRCPICPPEQGGLVACPSQSPPQTTGNVSWRCTSCDMVSDVALKLQVRNSLLDQLEEIFREGKASSGLKSLVSQLEALLHPLWNRALGNVYSQVARLWLLNGTPKGNLDECVHFAELSLRIVDSVYGEDSVEALWEVVALEQILGCVDGDNQTRKVALRGRKVKLVWIFFHQVVHYCWLDNN